MATITSVLSVPGHRYLIQTCIDLAAGQWSEVGEPVEGDGAPIVSEMPYSNAEPRRFYRIRITR